MAKYRSKVLPDKDFLWMRCVQCRSYFTVCLCPPTRCVECGTVVKTVVDSDGRRHILNVGGSPHDETDMGGCLQYPK